MDISTERTIMDENDNTELVVGLQPFGFDKCERCEKDVAQLWDKTCEIEVTEELLQRLEENGSIGPENQKT